MIALIDADLVVYMACAADQINADFEDGLGEEPLFDADTATKHAEKMIRSWTKTAGCKRHILCFSEGDNFRRKIYPDYKANRKDLARPEALLEVRENLELEHEILTIPGLEADDVMGISATSDRGQMVIVSRDKDMRTIPALVCNPDHDKKPVRIRNAVADQMWLKQTMTGDPVDGFSGIPGVGEVKAQEILLNPHKMVKKSRPLKRGKNAGKMKTWWEQGPRCGVWESMVSYAEKAGMPEDDLIVQAQISRILRSGEYDDNRRVVKLWTPNGHKELKLDE